MHVTFGAGGARTEDQLLGNSAAHRTDHARAQVLLAVAVPVVLGPLVGHAERHAVGHDGYAVDRVRVRQQQAKQRVATLVVSDTSALLQAHDQRPSRPENQGLERIQDVLVLDLVLVPTRGQQRGFVDQVAQVRSNQPGRR